MPLSDIVNVQITRQTQSVSEPGFGIPLILGTTKSFNDLLRKYNNLQQVSVDFKPYDPEYVAAQDLFAQQITPPYIYIGRRTVNTVSVAVETAMPDIEYTTTINGTDATINSTTTVDDSVVTLSGIVTNVITFDISFTRDNVSVPTVNTVALAPVAFSNGTSIIDFDIDFASGDSIVATVDGIALSAVPFNTDEATTLADLLTEIKTASGVDGSSSVSGSRQLTIVFTVPGNKAVDSVITTGGAEPTATITNDSTTITAIANEIGAASGVTSSTVTGPKEITVVFASSSSAIVNSVVTTLGATQPIATITQDGPLVASNSIAVEVNGHALTPVVFSGSSLATMTAIAAAIQAYLNSSQSVYSPGIATAVVSGINNNVITVTSNPNQPGIIDSFVVTLGSSQATAAIVNTAQPTDKNTIADAMMTEINGLSLGVIATVPLIPNGTFTLNPTVTNTPYTIAVRTDIVTPCNARVEITQGIPNQAYTVIINGTKYIYQAPNEPTDNTTIAAHLVELINALHPTQKLQPVTAVDNANGTFEINADITGIAFDIQVSPLEAMTVQFGLIIGPLVPSTSVVDDLVAIQNVNNDWYALACTDRTVATVKAIAAWIETQVKIFGTASSNSDIINKPLGGGSGDDSTSIAAVFHNLGYVRTFVIYHQDAETDYPECAWMGAVLPLAPGSETWAFKRLASIAYSTLTPTQQNNAFGKSCNTYEFVGGAGITQQGTMAQGEYIDIIRGVDWLTSIIQSYVYSILVNNPKVPYTDAGITAVESQIKRALQQGIDNNFIASSPVPQVFVPTAASVPAIDKANRILRNVKFQATLAGAIQAVEIFGTVSV
ncbi:MAG: hypothetical protein C5B43_04015 [Verrucomicrobia bacterium]|nr:MAG: hypothetical protein C5B43_04015 [Verrucomicrobiota bacterium]